MLFKLPKFSVSSNCLFIKMIGRGLLKNTNSRHSCCSFALADLAQTPELSFNRPPHGDFYGQALWKILLQVGEEGLRFDWEGSWSELAGSCLIGCLEVPEITGLSVCVLGCIFSPWPSAWLSVRTCVSVDHEALRGFMVTCLALKPTCKSMGKLFWVSF